MPSQSLRRPIRSGLLPVQPVADPADCWPRPVIAGRRRDELGVETPISVSTRAITSAEIIEAMTPIDSVTPKPLTGPEASTNSSPAASRVVTLESMIAVHALLNPICEGAPHPGAWVLGVLLAGSLEDQHVGVDRQSDGEHEAGQAGQGQRRPEDEQHGVGDQGVRRQRERREEADEAVDEDDEQAGQDEADQAGLGGGVDRRPRRASGRPCWSEISSTWQRQRAALDQGARSWAWLVGEVAGDVGGVGDAAAAGHGDVGRGDDVVVEHDRDPVLGALGAGGLAAELAERVGALAVEVDVDDLQPTVCLRLRGLGAVDLVALQRGRAELDDVALVGGQRPGCRACGLVFASGDGVAEDRVDRQLRGLADAAPRPRRLVL